MKNFEFYYPRYLKAKESVDERALSQRVIRRFFRELLRGNPSSLRLLEVGGGTGATLRRLFSRFDEGTGLQSVTYTFIEERGQNIEAAKRELRTWAADSGYQWTLERDRGVLRDRQDTGQRPDRLVVNFVEADFFDYAARQRDERHDAIIAQALFDLVDVGEALRTLTTQLRPGGLWYLPIHFDGVTAFEPVLERALDRRIERLYHRSMADPHTGRSLLSTLRETGSALLDVGASDWIVFGTDQEYAGDEAYFLKCILYFVVNELKNHDEISDASLSDWQEKRLAQIKEGALIYLAHQIDVCAKRTLK